MARHSRRRFLQAGLMLAGLGLLAGCGVLPPRAQAPKVARLGVLSNRRIEALPEGEAFRRGLRELGWVQGESARIEYRVAASPKGRAETVAVLVGLDLDVIVADGNALVRALKSAAGTTPIVMVSSRDPVAVGLVASLSRPGGNVTGLADPRPQLGAKRLELIKELMPGAARVAFAWNPDHHGEIDQGRLRATAAALGMQAQFAPFRDHRELRAAVEAAVAARADALILLSDLVRLGMTSTFLSLAAEARLPTVVESVHLVRDGALLGYGPSVPEQFRRAAAYVDQILRGAQPGELPVEQPTEFDLAVNLQTAQDLGLTVPQSVLMQATELIQ